MVKGTGTEKGRERGWDTREEKFFLKKREDSDDCCLFQAQDERVAIDKQTMKRMKKGKRGKACCERIFSFLLILFSDKERKKSCKKIEVKCGVKEKRKKEEIQLFFFANKEEEKWKEGREGERKNERKKERGWKEEVWRERKELNWNVSTNCITDCHEVFAKKCFMPIKSRPNSLSCEQNKEKN